jgi:hypothetical protein
LYQSINGQYTWFDSIQTSDSAGCNSQGNSDVWSGTFYGLGASQQWKLVAAYKSVTQFSGCDDPTGFFVAATKYFVSGNGQGS